MAIDTADKRRASIGFGMPQSAGTLIPSGATSAFRRGSALGLYHIVSTFTGYMFSPSRRLVGSRLLTRLEGTATTSIELTGTDIKTRTVEGPAK